ncbi:MAG: endonuclease IV [Clostridiales bacterium]|nr:endonuclease IV [Clostridiales bacterium]
MIKFGPSGACEEFNAQGFKKTSDGAKWLRDRGVDLFEYSFGRGVNISEEKAIAYGKVFKEEGIELSVHAPYFINLATVEEDKALNNIKYIETSLKALKDFGGNRCVFHPGSPVKLDRREAMNILLKAFEQIVQIKNDNGYKDLYLCPETMGKLAQLGDLEEIIEIINVGDENIIPCIDFGHLNARTQGCFKSKDDYKRVIDRLIDGIGENKTMNMHVHFSKIQYTDKGELRHLTFEDNYYGPDYEPLMEVFSDYKMSPYVVCESAGTQTRDSMAMKDYFVKYNK